MIGPSNPALSPGARHSAHFPELTATYLGLLAHFERLKCVLVEQLMISLEVKPKVHTVLPQLQGRSTEITTISQQGPQSSRSVCVYEHLGPRCGHKWRDIYCCCGSNTVFLHVTLPQSWSLKLWMFENSDEHRNCEHSSWQLKRLKYSMWVNARPRRAKEWPLSPSITLIWGIQITIFKTSLETILPWFSMIYGC